jgi:hypothetical protein
MKEYTENHKDIIKYRKKNLNNLFTSKELNRKMIGDNDKKLLLAITEFVGNGYLDMNQILRDNKQDIIECFNNPPTDDFDNPCDILNDDNHVLNLIKLINMQEISKEDRIVYRFTPWTDKRYNFKNKKINDIFVKPEFISTSAFPYVEQNNSYILHQIKIPKNNKLLMVHVGPYTESEVLFFPGQKLKLVDKIKNFKDFESDNTKPVLFLKWEIVGNIYANTNKKWNEKIKYIDSINIFGGKKIKKKKRKSKKIRKHSGINQSTGRLKKGYKYSDKKLKSGLSQIIKIKNKKKIKI